MAVTGLKSTCFLLDWNSSQFQVQGFNLPTKCRDWPDGSEFDSFFLTGRKMEIIVIRQHVPGIHPHCMQETLGPNRHFITSVTALAGRCFDLSC